MYRSSLLDFERLWGKKSVEEPIENKETVENSSSSSPVVEETVSGDNVESSYEKKIDALVDKELENMKNEDVDAKDVTLDEATTEPAVKETVEEHTLEPVSEFVPVSKPSLFKRFFSCGSSRVLV
jgi:hypothetical protein